MFNLLWEARGGLKLKVYFQPNTWVDDCLIFYWKKELADKFIYDLKHQFTLSEEGEVSAYLGVKMELEEETGQVTTISQPFLIQRIIELLGNGMNEANAKDTPAKYKEILHKDELGLWRKKKWKYRSIVPY